MPSGQKCVVERKSWGCRIRPCEARPFRDATLVRRHFAAIGHCVVPIHGRARITFASIVARSAWRKGLVRRAISGAMPSASAKPEMISTGQKAAWHGVMAHGIVFHRLTGRHAAVRVLSHFPVISGRYRDVGLRYPVVGYPSLHLFRCERGSRVLLRSWWRHHIESGALSVGVHAEDRYIGAVKGPRPSD